MLSTAVSTVFAQVGFQAKFDKYPSFVSPFEKEEPVFSVALYRKTVDYLSYKYSRRPRLIAASFENNTLKFEAEYFRQGLEKKNLIPVTVNAHEFAEYNFSKMYNKGFWEYSHKNRLENKDKKKSGGLGLSVALPKRLDKIFGEGGAGLKVSGRRRVTFSGRSQWNDAAESETYRQSRFPSLKMEQISRFDITGTIGSKISVKVSQDSQTDIPLANRIQIRYKGDDDDILKTIEAGNTTLSLPNTQFVGYSSRIRGLFGVKAKAQVGHLHITAIASQEKGSTEKTSFSASGEENAKTIRDYEYEQRRIFDLGARDEFHPNDKIRTVYLYESISDYSTNRNGKIANFYVDPDDTTKFTAENITGGDIWSVQIPPDQYVPYDDPARNLHYVIFNSNRSPNYHIGAYMVIDRHDGSTDIIGDVSGDEYRLKLIAPSESKARPNQQTWQYMWRNCYRIPRSSVASELNLKIFKGFDGTEQQTDNLDYQLVQGVNYKYMEILGLDQYDNLDRRQPDRVLDERQSVFRPDLGLIIFPNRRPFDSDTTYLTETSEIPAIFEEDRLPKIYDYSNFSEKAEKSNFYLWYSTKSKTSVIKLNRANIIEGSDRVYANGQLLVRGEDYNIQYEFGQITLISEIALDPNSDISVDFEYAPFFAVQKKSLFGIRGEYEWSRDLKLGSTFLYKSDKAQDRKPKVGQETARTIIYDADLSWKLYPNFLTKVVDALPLVETEVASNMSITGEVAQSHPNPNVDNIAYVDDFESAQDDLGLGTSRLNWKIASFPYHLNPDDYNQGKILWHRTKELTPVEDIYNRDTRAGEGHLNIFRLIYRPDNLKEEIVIDGNDTTITTRMTKSWAGIQRFFNRRVDNKRAQLFEVRAKATRGKLHFDFGVISEDINNNANPESEDNYPRGDLNGAVDAYEDVGLDGLPDEEEPGYDPLTNPDPSGDNYYFRGRGKCPVPGGCEGYDWENDDSLYYEFLNGTEGNLEETSVPDKEVFSTTNGFETNNVYYSFVIDFASDSFRVADSERRPEGDDKSWWTYRIPIRDSLAIDELVSSDASLIPSWAEISHIRVWFESDEGQTSPDTLEIADWGFVQSNWQDSVIYASPFKQTSFVVAEVSDEVDTSFTPPPGVEAYTDPATSLVEAQKAMLLSFENLHYQDSCIATKDLLTIDTYSGYRKMEMYVHGKYFDQEDDGNIKFFFRIGKDERNYYEAFRYIKQGWDPDNYISIDFNELTALKDTALQALAVGDTLDISNDKYRVYGKPNINEIRYFVAGIINTDSTKTIDGEVWLDELRVTEVRRDVGTAARLNITGNLADLISYGFALKNQDPYFRGLSSATRGGSSNNLGSGNDEKSYNYNVTLNLQKILPRSWEARIPITYSYSKNTRLPLLRTNSDIILPEETRKKEESVNENKSLSISTQFNRKGKNPLFSFLLNRLKTRFSYRRQNNKSVTNPYQFVELYDISADYNLSIKKPPTLPIFFWTKPIPILKKISGSRLWLYPSSWTTSARYNRSINVSDDVNNERRSTIKRNFNANMNLSYKFFDNLTTTFGIDTRRDMSDLDKVNIQLSNLRLGLETHYGQRFSVNYDPKLLTFLTSSFSFQSNYSDDYERSNQTLRSSFSKSISVKGKFNHVLLFQGQAKGSKGARHSGRRRVGVSKESDEKDGKVEKGKPFYDPIFGVLRGLTGWINPFAYSYTQTFNKSLPGMVDRPAMSYRFGFHDSPDVEISDDPQPASSGRGESYDIGSGFNFLGGLVTTVKFKESVNTDLIKRGTLYRNTSTSWPELTIRIQKFKRLPIIKRVVNKFIDVFAPRTGFAKQTKKTEDITNGFITNRTTSTKYNPLLSINFKLFRSLSLSASYNFSEDKRESFSPVDGKLETVSNATNRSFALTSNYSFTSPHGISIPLFGKLKFRSTVDLRLTVKFNASKTETSNNGGPFAPTVDKSDFTFSPVISYTFSRQIKGGLTLRWQDTNDNYKNRKTHTREVQLWTEITF